MMVTRRMVAQFLAALAAAPAPMPALAQTPAARDGVRIGVVLSTTGPGASLGIPEANTVALLPRRLGALAVEYLVLDDATDTSAAVRAMRKLVDEDHVDLVIGSTVTPSTIAMTAVAAETGTPVITLAAASSLVQPVEGAKRWVFKTPQNDSMMASAILDHAAAAKLGTLGFIGFSDSLGEGWLTEVQAQAPARGIRVVSVQRYGRTDASVTGQVLKLIADKPDAVLVAGYGAPAALPQKTLRERGYAGPIYQTHGAANADFLRLGGKDVNGTLLPVGPVLVAPLLPADNPIRAVALDYIQTYEAKYGAGSASAFGSYAWDAGLLLAVALPVAAQHGQPGTPAFRAALRDALEGLRGVVTTNGVVTTSATDHVGLDDRARVMAVIEQGGAAPWKPLP